MFDSLEEQIRKDQNKASTSGQRMMMYVIYALVGVLVCGGVILGVHMLG